ncbi:site-specific DNA-methyltransferase [Streptomyces platensis]|uniref:site-specific DNA-methyltransferase n=1 Tax=Streptomyces platensis TaxID=58346 RepID=UPI002E160EEE|nr:site-specific DNA-methyltransferase [Streptomyces platensis]
MIEPYYRDPDGTVVLYLGDSRQILPELGLQADLVVADPPYGETKNPWDRWPAGWLETVAGHSCSLWCFGSQRMFFKHLRDFEVAGWRLSQDVVGHDDDGSPMYGDVNVVWEKHNGTGFATDRFKRVHEHALHWYRGPWGGVHQEVPRVAYTGSDKHAIARASRTPHTGAIGAHVYEDDGTRLMRSVIKAKSVRGKRRHPDEKPLDILKPLIEYGCPHDGLVVDPFAGSGSTLDAARRVRRRAVGIEASEEYAEAAARRLSEPLKIDLFGEAA